MVRLLGLVFFVLAVVSVRATAPNPGWSAYIDANTTAVEVSYGNLAVQSLVTLDRGGSKATSLLLQVFASPYSITNSSDEFDVDLTTQLSSVTVAVDSVDQLSLPLSFNLNSSWSDYYISVEISTSNELLDHRAGDVVLALDQDYQWYAIAVGDYQHQINLAIIDELDNFEGESYDSEDPEPETEGRTDPEIWPELPKENPSPNSTVTTSGVSTTVAWNVSSTSLWSTSGSIASNWSGSYSRTTSLQSFTTVTTTSGDSTIDFRPSDETATTRDALTISTTGDNNADFVTVVVTRTTTVCPPPTPPPPCPPPPPPPCPQKRDALDRRQADSDSIDARVAVLSQTTTPAYLTVYFRFKDRNGVLRPIVGQNIVLFARVYNSANVQIPSVKATATTKTGGVATFKFLTRYGEKVVVYAMHAELSSYNYRIVTRQTVNDAFEVSWVKTKLHSSHFMTVNAGEKATYVRKFPKVPSTRGFEVADALYVVTEYARKNVFLKGEQKPIHVWYPSPVSGPFTKSAWTQLTYINLPYIYTKYAGTIAHEYGHFVHLLGNRKGDLPGPGGPHFTCPGTAIDTGLAFSEGFASAFGVVALDKTHLQSGYMIQEIRGQNGLPVNFDLEAFNCKNVGLVGDEMRVSAAIIDLVDRKNDKFPTTSNDIGNVDPPFDPKLVNVHFDPRLIFYRVIRHDPQSMDDYWNKLKPFLSDLGKKRVLAILKYNQAEPELFKL